MLISFYSTEPGIVMAATVEFFLGLELAMSEDPSEYQMRRPVSCQSNTSSSILGTSSVTHLGLVQQV